VLMAQFGIKQEDGHGFSTDDWDGYPANRSRLLKHIHDSQAANPVVIGGDAHSFFANDLRLDFDDSTAPIVATEFVGHLDLLVWPTVRANRAVAARQSACSFL
jgi:alkaline phosphatase D